MVTFTSYLDMKFELLTNNYTLCVIHLAPYKLRIDLQYLKTSPHDPDLDDAADFKRMDQAMDAVGISINTKMDIYRVVAAVLHLGNVNFEENTKDKKGNSCLEFPCLHSRIKQLNYVIFPYGQMFHYIKSKERNQE